MLKLPILKVTYCWNYLFCVCKNERNYIKNLFFNCIIQTVIQTLCTFYYNTIQTYKIYKTYTIQIYYKIIQTFLKFLNRNTNCMQLRVFNDFGQNVDRVERQSFLAKFFFSFPNLFIVSLLTFLCSAALSFLVQP